jgi:tetratricopeptide (TPR) repeat protein
MGFYKMMSSKVVLIGILSALICAALAQEKPKKPEVLHEQAERVYNEGKYKEALLLLNECLKVNPGYMEAYPTRAAVREQLKDEDGALVDYSIYLEKYPLHPEVLMSRALLRYKIGFYEQAEEDFFRLLLLPPGETNSVFYKKSMSVDDKNPMVTTQGSHTSHVYNYIGLSESKLKHFEKAKAYFDTAIRLDNKEPDYFVNRGLTKETLKDSSAIQDYESALKLNPNHALALHNLTALKSKKVQTMSTEDRLTQTIAIDSTMLLPYLERAQQRFESKYYQGAVDDYTDALEIDSSNVEIWLGRGLSREKLKDFKGAFSDYTKAISLKENYDKAWLNRGNVLLKLERYSDAIEDYNVALIYNAEYAPAFYNRAMARIKLKKNAEACADLKQAEMLGMKVDEKLKAKTCEGK